MTDFSITFQKPYLLPQKNKTNNKRLGYVVRCEKAIVNPSIDKDNSKVVTNVKVSEMAAKVSITTTTYH